MVDKNEKVVNALATQTEDVGIDVSTLTTLEALSKLAKASDNEAFGKSVGKYIDKEISYLHLGMDMLVNNGKLRAKMGGADIKKAISLASILKAEAEKREVLDLLEEGIKGGVGIITKEAENQKKVGSALSVDRYTRFE